MAKQNYQILFGVTGSIAAYKAVELLRILRKREVDCTVTMTHSAQKFVTPYTFEIFSEKPVWLNLFDYQDYHIPHVEIANNISAIVIAPATAQVIHDIAHAKADSPLLSSILSSSCPVIIAPAMETKMWENQLVQNNIRILKQYNRFYFVGPDSGDLASGKKGFGRMVEPNELCEQIFTILSLYQKTERINDFANESIVITAGPTRESLDPMRYISNRSSGKMGYALARAAASRKAKVFLISGHTNISLPANVEVTLIETAEQMLNASIEIFQKHSITGCIGTAAVCDFRAKNISEQKISKRSLQEQFDLVLNPDIMKTLNDRFGKNTVFVGFAAETSQIIEHAKEKLLSKNLDLICANSISNSNGHNNLASDQKKISILFRDGVIETYGPDSKEQIANNILDEYLKIRKNKDRSIIH